MHVCAPQARSTLRGQEMASDPLKLELYGCGPPHGCWELNSGPMEEEAVLLPVEVSLQHVSILKAM